MATEYTTYVADPLPAGTRLVKLSVRIPLPTPVELTGEIEIKEEGTKLTVS